MTELLKLSPRERQIIEAVFRRGEATVAEVRNEIPDPPGYDAVRTTMRLLEEKGLLEHREEGPRYVYRATLDKGDVRHGALRNLVRTFFDGSAWSAAVALLQLGGMEPSEEEVEELRALIEKAESGEDGR